MQGPLAQSVEQKTFNLLVEGSNPSRPTNAIKDLGVRKGAFFIASVKRSVKHQHSLVILVSIASSSGRLS